MTADNPPSPPGRTFEHLRRQRTVVLTSFRRDGSPVPTPVTLAVDPSDPTIAYMRTWSSAGKAKRIRNDPRVTIAPSTFRGRVLGPAVDATAKLLEGEPDAHARRLIVRKHPLLQGVLVPFGHHLRRNVTQHYVLRVQDSA